MNFKTPIRAVFGKRRRIVSMQFISFLLLYMANKHLFAASLRWQTGIEFMASDIQSILIGYVILIGFLYAAWNKIKDEPQIPTRKERILWLILLVITYANIDNLIVSNRGALALFIGLLSLIFLTHALVFLMVFGAKRISSMRTEIALCVMVFAIMYIGMFLIQLTGLQTLSRSIMVVIVAILTTIGVKMTANTTSGYVSVNEFDIIIGPACTGVGFAAVFMLMFVSYIFLISYKNKIGLRRSVVFFTLGLIGVYVANIIRVLLIIVVGAYFDQKFAINAFHNGIGSAIFLVFFLPYIYFVIPLIIKKN